MDAIHGCYSSYLCLTRLIIENNIQFKIVPLVPLAIHKGVLRCIYIRLAIQQMSVITNMHSSSGNCQ